MAYIKANNVSGKVSSSFVSLTLNGTTASFSSDPGIPTITSPDKIRITIAPGTAQEEILDISAHSSGSTTATVIRNVEATQNGQNSGAAHSGVDWTHGVNASDILVPGTTAFEDAVRSAADLTDFDPLTTDFDFGTHRGINVAPAMGPTDLPNIGQLAGLGMPYVVSGCVWTADASGSTLLGSMTAGTIVIKGVLLTVAAINNHTFAASRDTYVDFTDNGIGGASVTFNAQVNNHTSPALAGTNVLDTLRNAIIVSSATALTTGVNTINQGAMSSGPESNTIASASATTVAAGSNGAAVNAATLSVASNTLATAGIVRVDTSTGAGAHFATLVKYTGGGGTTTLTGCTVIGNGNPAGTVATGGAVFQMAAFEVCDSLGNRIYPTTPYPGVIGARTTEAVVGTSTLTSALAIPSLSIPFVVPPGVSRRIKSTLILALMKSSGSAGTALNMSSFIDGTQISAQSGSVKVASDGDAFTHVSHGLVSPGTHMMNYYVQQGAAGTLSLGILFVASKAMVELV